MADNSALCLRLDLDTFSSEDACSGDAGGGDFEYVSRILRVAEVHGAKLQFCVCGRGVRQYPFATRSILEAGHAVDPHLHSHRANLVDSVTRVAEELLRTEEVFAAQRVAWCGIGGSGTHASGIDRRADVQALLGERGYQWCSSKYDPQLPLADMQPYWLDEFVLEIPCAGTSGRDWFVGGDASLPEFIATVLGKLEEAARTDQIYALDVHPGVLAKHDPECELVTKAISRAVELGVPLITMDQISQWAIACREVERFRSGERVGDGPAFWHDCTWLEEAWSPGRSPTVRRCLEAEGRWGEVGANPIQQPEKVVDYVGGYRLFPNSYGRAGVRINRFGLRGEDCLRTAPKGMKRILCIGDSCVFGMPNVSGPLGAEAPDNGPWPARLQMELDRLAPLRFQILNAGVNGQSSRHVYLRLAQLLRGLRPELVLISVLANDAWAISESDAQNAREYEPVSFARNIRWAMSTCVHYGATPVLITPPGMVPTDCRMTSFMLEVYHQAWAWGDRKQPARMRWLYDVHNDALRTLARENGVACIDTARAFDERLDDRRGQLFFDTCHMLPAGNVEMGRIIAEGVLKLRMPTHGSAGGGC